MAPLAAPRPLLAAMLAASLAAALAWYGPPGTDLAAHLYQRTLFLKDGFALWNNYWYAGRYSLVTYSLFYYPLAALTGIKVLATASVGIGACAFGVIVEREWGHAARRASWLFAIALAASVLSAAFPYMLGLAFALVALAALQARRFKTFGVLVTATFAASPLAFLLLVLILTAALVRSRRLWRRGVLPVAATAAGGAALWKLFPGNGAFPFAFVELAAALVFCLGGLLFTWHVERARLLFNFFAIYGVACIACYVIPSDVGANIVRLRFIALPLAALTLSLRRWRPLLPALAALALALAWNVTPLASSYTRATHDPSAELAYWTPTIAFLHAHLGPAYRVEAVDTTGHWEADYLPAAGIPLVRGWFRQDDFPENALLYRPLSSGAYLRWLRQMAVRYVVLTDAPVDYSARFERRLLESGRSGLPVAFRDAHTTIFAVPSPHSIVTGPRDPRVIAFRGSSVTLVVKTAGTYHVALRYTPYWTAPGACIAESRDGMVNLGTRQAGTFVLSFAVTASNALAALAGSHAACDAASPAAARSSR